MSDEQMLGPWFKEFADLGHWFDTAHGKCIRCGVPTIDLYEDGSYGETRSCAQGMETREGQDTEEWLGAKHDSPVPNGDAPKTSPSERERTKR